MVCESNSAGKIESGVVWELQNCKGEVRVGLEATFGLGKTSGALDLLTAMIQTQESPELSRKVVVHDFVQALRSGPSRSRNCVSKMTPINSTWNH
jgi:hypothetical protein